MITPYSSARAITQASFSAHFLRTALISSTVSLSLLSAVPALAAQSAAAQARIDSLETDTEILDFAIKAQSLSRALLEFSRETGKQLFVDDSLLTGLKSTGVTGKMTANQALAQLLKGTGLQHAVSKDNTVSLKRRPSSSLVPLNKIDVDALRSANDRLGAADRIVSIQVAHDDIKRRNPTTVKKVFAGNSAVTVGGAIALTQKVYVNGVEEGNLAVSVDGARQGGSIFHHTGENPIDPMLLKKVRVDPGVAPADAGPMALAGAIVYETVDVVDLLKDGKSAGGFVSAGYDTDSQTRELSLAGYGRINAFEGLAFVRLADGDDYTAGDGLAVRGTGTDLKSFLLKGAYNARHGHRFEVSANHLGDGADRPFRANIRSITTRPNDPIVREYDLQRNNLTFNYSQVGAAGLWDPKIVLAYADSELAVPVPYESNGLTRSTSGKFENDFNLSGTNTITAGLDFFSDSARYFDPSDDMIERLRNTGVYAQARFHPLDPVRVSAGLRRDHQKFTGIDGTQFDRDGSSNNVSLAWDVNPGLTFNAGYSNIWGGIRLGETFIFNPAWDYSAGITPVESENFILGVETTFSSLALTANVFKSNFTNARKPAYRGGTNLTDDFNTEGFTLGAEYRWGNGFFRLSYTDTSIEVNGVAANSYTSQYLGAPLGRVVSLEANHRLRGTGLAIGGTIDAALQNSETVASGEGGIIEAYTVLNLYSEYRPASMKALSIRFEANNVFDEEYADRGTYGTEFATVKPLLEPGRSFRLIARYAF